MNKERFSIVCVLVLFAISMFSGIVSAGIAEDINAGFGNAYTALKPTLEVAVGGTENSPELFFAKLLFLVIIFSIVFASLDKIDFFNTKEWSLWVVSIAVSLLSVRWINRVDVIQAMLLPYSTLGVALTAGLPFVIYFFVVKDFTSKIARKTAWIFFMVIFVSLWYMRMDEIQGAGLIYLITAGLAFISLLFDGVIQRAMARATMERTRHYANQKLINAQRDAINIADDQYARGVIDRDEHERVVKEARRKIDHLLRTK